MAFPITVTGVVKLPFGTERISVAEYMSAVEKSLENEKAKKIVVSGNKITFRGGMFRFVSKSNLLVTIDHGQVQVEELPTIVHNHREKYDNKEKHERVCPRQRTT